MATLLQPERGPGYTNASESARVTAFAYDFDNSQLDKAALKTLTITLKDDAGSVINSRNGSDVLDTDIGSVATDGTITLKLSPADNAYQGDADTVEESHWLLLAWTWDDNDGDEQSNSQLFEIPIRKMPG